jgi:hypothetical protein
MATVLLSAVGAAIGSGFGGTVLGLSGAVVGRAVGATLGQVIDQKLMGSGSSVVEVGRVERFRVMGASEGATVGVPFGRVRLAGQVIWSTRFRETVSESSVGGGGGKGMPRPASATQRTYSYSVSLAIALCEGAIQRVGRVWADGIEIARGSIHLRIYPGSEDQLPDPKIAAVEGAGNAPAYRGTAYVVIEDLALGPYGNRIPQFSFEVIRPAQEATAHGTRGFVDVVRAVALMPGTGEYALATTPVHYRLGPGLNRTANVHTPSGKTDMALSLEQLREELPLCRSVSLIVSWFGDDLRCGSCKVRPKVEQKENDGERMTWRAGGIGRGDAEPIAQVDGRPIYGGTPADASVVQAIRAIRSGGQEAMFYPFILMEQLAGNSLPDPWSGGTSQPVLPWRGRITLSTAPGRAGTPDRTVAAEAEVSAFFGAALPSHFVRNGDEVVYSGPPGDWGYRRFILHYAHLCAAAGGVDAFCIGSEMRGLTQIRGAGNSFPAVVALRQLAAEVRTILGPDAKISYAADWSEYFGYHDAEGNVQFHLDPLWADSNVDFIGIDNYMPLSDWRDGSAHADAGWRSIYNIDYLKANVAGGEGYAWYYATAADEAAQVRTPITDGAYGEPWVFRYKDIRNWWSHPHHDRLGGVRSSAPTPWVPGSKPIRFTEFGCAAIDKATNEPNKFLDPKSSESRLPRFSTGRRDDFIQMQYLRAIRDFWEDPANNPASPVYGGRMLDMERAHVWAWDARPFPVFPNLLSTWSDGENFARGHWLNGRATNQMLASVVSDVCERSGVGEIDVSELYGAVRGFWISDIGSARAGLQPLMLAYGFDAIERDGKLMFRLRDGASVSTLVEGSLAVTPEFEGTIETARAPEAETAGRLRIGFTEAEGDFEARQAEAVFPDEESLGVSASELPVTLTQAEARGVAERWLSEARLARDSIRFALPPSRLSLGAGDVVQIADARYRIDRLDLAEMQIAEAVRVDASSYVPVDNTETRTAPAPVVADTPVFPIFLDLPLLPGTEGSLAPFVAVTATPWQGPVAVWTSGSDTGFEVNRIIGASSVIGITETPLRASPGSCWDRGPALRVRVFGGTLASVAPGDVLNGRNLAAIGDGTPGNWELFQFADAELVAPQTYELRFRLRGQAGTESVMPQEWPEGSYLVLMDRGPEQIDLPLSSRGLARTYRIGAARLGFDAVSVVEQVRVFQGIGLRPYAPVHLRAEPLANGGLVLTWVRRTRVDGDTWESVEAPLGEETEAYRLEIWAGNLRVRSVDLTVPRYIYTDADWTADRLNGPLEMRVSQLSNQFGSGPSARRLL